MQDASILRQRYGTQTPRDKPQGGWRHATRVCSPRSTPIETVQSAARPRRPLCSDGYKFENGWRAPPLGP